MDNVPVMEALTALEQWAVGFVGTPWFLLVLFGFVVIDGVFPPVPSESVVIAAAALTAAGDGPNLWLLAVIAATGAFTGDLLAYSIGSVVPAERFVRRRRITAIMTRARLLLDERATLFIVGARFIPIGRVAVNMTAGSVGFPRRRFAAIAVVAAVLWAGYSVMLGVGAAALLGDDPLLAAAVGVVGGVCIGLVADVVARRFHRRAPLARGGDGGTRPTGELDEAA